MTAGLEALLTALYVLIDDHVIPSGQRRPGRPKKLSGAELACLAVAQVLLGARSEHHWLRLCYGRLGTCSRTCPSSPATTNGSRRPGRCWPPALDYLARECTSWYDPVRLVDATSVPCGASRETVRRSELAGWAGYGYCAAHSRWYGGLKLYLITTPDGMPVAWCLASPKLGEREVAADLLAHAARTATCRRVTPYRRNRSGPAGHTPSSPVNPENRGVSLCRSRRPGVGPHPWTAAPQRREHHDHAKRSFRRPGR